MATPERVQVHRFHDTLAVSFLGCDGGTFYLSPELVDRLAAELRRGANDLAQRRFSASQFGTVRVDAKGGDVVE